MTRTIQSSAFVLLFFVGGCATSHSAATGATPSVAAVTTTGEDRAALAADLAQSRQAFLDAVKGLSDAQLRFKAAPDRWSVLETAEHIALAEDTIFQATTEKVMTSPVTPELRAKWNGDDARIRRALLDRTQKRKAPERIQPTGRFASMNDLLAAFEKSRARTIAYAQDGQNDLRGHMLAHPAVGVLDADQWLLFLSAHCARHTAQIEEVKADPNFPKS